MKMTGLKSFFTLKKKLPTLVFLAFLSVVLVTSFVSPTDNPNNVVNQSGAKPDIAGVQIILPTNTESLKEKSALTQDDRQVAILVKVVDGDTISVSINGKKETIRVIGIDTPEVVDPRKKVECFGKEASEMAKSLFEDNKTVLLESDSTQGERDRYQRLLRHVWIKNETINFGLQMIAEGYASEYTYNTPYKYQEEYRIVQKKAQDEKKGLWADDACVTSIVQPR